MTKRTLYFFLGLSLVLVPLLAGADIVLDGTDGFATRFAVSAACRALGRTLVSGAVGRWEGQVVTFKPGGPCYRCLVPEAPPHAETCAQVGVAEHFAGLHVAVDIVGEEYFHQAVDRVPGRGAEGIAEPAPGLEIDQSRHAFGFPGGATAKLFRKPHELQR